MVWVYCRIIVCGEIFCKISKYFKIGKIWGDKIVYDD